MRVDAWQGHRDVRGDLRFVGHNNGVEMNIKQIVEERLRRDGYDGLCNVDCGCKLSDLMSCGCPFLDCRPGYIRHGTFEGVKNTWIIVEAKKNDNQHG